MGMKRWSMAWAGLCVIAGCGGTPMETDGGGALDGSLDAQGADTTVPRDAPPMDTSTDAPMAVVDAFVAPDANGACGGCDDHVACTLDACVGTTCTHTVAHGRCSGGQYCDATLGCHAGNACAAAADCMRPDTCVTVRCNTTSATCEYAVLDHDLDGDPPIVCGGTDCNDASSAISGLTPEICDGVDQDCDTRIDEANATTSACGDLSVCTGGTCRCGVEHDLCLVSEPADPFGYRQECVDVQSDPRACGSCDNACPDGIACVHGVCACPAATPDACNGACLDFRTDPQSCGTCANVCPDAIACVAGVCNCPAGTHACGAACVDYATDESNCGSCGNVCFGGVTCTAGRCPCAGGVTTCSGTCTNLTDNFCGACNQYCEGTCNPTTHACTCTGAGQTACRYDDGTGGYQVQCIDLMTNEYACGDCNHRCPNHEGCVGGVCTGCLAPYMDCGAGGAPNCIDVTSDSENCGACGRTCAGSRTGTCSGGRCF